jgi:hypothetical protein
MRVATAMLVATAAGCGGDNTGPNGQNNGDMTAKIDGASFTSVATEAQRNVTNAGTIIAISGADAHGTGLGFGFVDAGVGTYPIGGLTPTNATVLDGTGKVWTAGATGGSGTLTVTALDATHVAGTFAYSAVASAGSGATGTKAVTQGVFDVTF